MRLAPTALSLVRWFDSWAGQEGPDPPRPVKVEKDVDWLRILPLIGVHVGCVGLLFVGWSWTALFVAALSFAVRMFAVTGFYHRYFSHKSFDTSRIASFVFALVGAAASQRGPLWWAAHHRLHHAHADQPSDVHSPKQHGFAWSHLGWITSRSSFRTRRETVPDLDRHPELRFLDRFDTFVPMLLLGSLYVLGEVLAASWPALGTHGPQLVVWGFFVATVVLLHCSLTINSLAHRMGSRPYETRDDSRNSLILALLTFGEGWHNNHHAYPASARQGFRWWQVDLTWYGLLVLERMGIIWNLRPVPERILRQAA